jgi:hypothetical protein
MRTRQLAVTFSVAVGLFTALLPADGQTNWKVTKEFQVGGEGGWDYLTVDSEGHTPFWGKSWRNPTPTASFTIADCGAC